MGKKLKYGLPLLMVVLLGITLLSASSMTDISDYGKLINYVGIVRGASQRVVKLETNNMPDDKVVDYVSGIVEELVTGQGSYGLIRTACQPLNDNLELLQRKWLAMKEEFAHVRSGGDKSELLQLSEEFFDLANDTVFIIEEYSSQRSRTMARQLAVVSLICLVCSVALISYSVRKYFRLRRQTEELEEQAGHDTLTGALTTERFCRDAQKLIEEHPERKYAVSYMDFENFKYVNDVFGYDSGDQILKIYSQRMLEQLQEGELFCRSTADCFLSLHIYQDKGQLLKRQQQADNVFLNSDYLPGKHRMTVACGFCCIEDVVEQLDVMGLVDRANYAQKTVKNLSDSHYAFYNESIRQKMFGEIRIADQLKSAVENREFLVYIQPKVCPFKGRVCSGEALVRWQTQDGQFLPPDSFIPVFERKRTIGVVDEYVFEEVCRLLQQRLQEGRPVVPVSVNVSKIRLYTPDFVKVYTDIKRRYGIPDGVLEIEFTETTACENLEYMGEIVDELHKNGFLCSLDDFGTGYSSLGMLKNLSIDTLKLDAQFFRNTLDIEKAQLVIRGVIQLIRKLKIQTVAEGIETAEQVEFLKECGCDMIQGYYYYRPMPSADFAKLLDENGGKT